MCNAIKFRMEMILNQINWIDDYIASVLVELFNASL